MKRRRGGHACRPSEGDGPCLADEEMRQDPRDHLRERHDAPQRVRPSRGPVPGPAARPPHCSLGNLVGAFSNAGRSPRPARRPGRRNLCRDGAVGAVRDAHALGLAALRSRGLERWGDLEVGELPSIPEEIAWGTGLVASYCRRRRSRRRSTPRSPPPRNTTPHLGAGPVGFSRATPRQGGGGALTVGGRALASAHGRPVHDRPQRGRGDRALPGLRAGLDRHLDDLRHRLRRTGRRT